MDVSAGLQHRENVRKDGVEVGVSDECPCQLNVDDVEVGDEGLWGRVVDVVGVAFEVGEPGLGGQVGGVDVEGV